MKQHRKTSLSCHEWTHITNLLHDVHLLKLNYLGPAAVTTVWPVYMISPAVVVDDPNKQSAVGQ